MCDLRPLLSALAITAALALIARSPGQTTRAGEADRIGDRAEGILRAMGEHLGSADEFSFHADVVYDSVLGTGQKIQYGGAADVTVRRPDRFRVEYRGDQRRTGVFLDRAQFTLLDRETNLYAQAEVPANIDGAVDLVFDRFGFSVPIADFVYADPFRILTEYAETGAWIGRHEVDGTPCHHLAFTQETIDWQIWIEDGPRPLPRKLVITYRDEPFAPQYSVRLSGWDLQARAADGWFTFEPPVGASEIEFLTLEGVPYREIEP